VGQAKIKREKNIKSITFANRVPSISLKKISYKYIQGYQIRIELDQIV